MGRTSNPPKPAAAAQRATVGARRTVPVASTGRSARPPRVRDYRSRVLVQEVADLIVALGADSAAVAGHDWGGGLAWLLAMQHPERVQRLVVLNAPHPIRFLKGLGSPRQLRRSWYILTFQLPWLPERLVAARDFQALRGALGRQPTRPGASTDEDIDRYVAAAAQPGALRAAINFYRAALRANPLAQAHTLRRVDVPALIIWGDQDRYLGRELAEPDRAWVPDVWSSGSPRRATGCRPTPPSGSTNSWSTSSSPSAAKTRESAQGPPA